MNFKIKSVNLITVKNAAILPAVEDLQKFGTNFYFLWLNMPFHIKYL